MKILTVRPLISRGAFPESDEYKAIIREVREAICSIERPEGSGEFVLHPTKKGNGVKPIKNACMRQLKTNKWELEVPMLLGSRKKPGRIDAVKTLPNGSKFALEWETGNISSSHRAINKMVFGLLTGELVGGILVLPSRIMYKYLTDRVGNYEELEPYFPVWENVNVAEGVVAVIEIQHDRVSVSSRRIPKGTNGRALR
jgi:hypothetical protein